VFSEYRSRTISIEGILVKNIEIYNEKASGTAILGGKSLMITRETRIIDALQVNPKTAEVFERFGMGCIGCMGITMETIENGAKMHHISLEELIKELNDVIGQISN
jgi:hybrid cluster-associated redox disulfide protein